MTPTSSSRFSVAPPDGPRPAIPDPDSRFRKGKGWYLGGDLGVGAVADSWSNGDDSGGSAGFMHLRFGGKLSRRLGLSVEFWSDGYNNQDNFLNVQRFVQNTVALAASYYMTPRIWVTAGVGSSTLHDYSGPEKVSNDGSAMMVGLGFEVLQREKYSIDMTFRLITSSYDVGFTELGRTSAAFGLGATWH